MIKVKNKGPNKGRDSVNQLVESIAKKEKPHTLKLQSRIGFTSKPNISLCSEGSKNLILDDASILKKKPTVKCLATQNKKLVKTAKLCNAQIVSQLNQDSIPQSERHVRFSDMNHTLEPGRKASVCPKLQTVGCLNSNGIPADSAIPDVNESDEDDLTQTAAAACSTKYLQLFSHPPSSYVAINGNENGKLPFTPQSSTVNYPNHVMQYQPFCDLTPNELMHSLHSFPDWKQRADTGEGKCVDPSFFGLPLIQRNSNSAVTGSCCFDLNSGAPTKDMSNVFPHWNGMNENDKSRIQGIDGHCFNPVREPNHSFFHLESDLRQLKNTCHGHKQYNQVQNQIVDGKGFQQGNSKDVAVHWTQPTMRLMGKEFTVGRSSKDLQVFEDGKVWTDKKIIAEHRPSDTSIGSSTLQQPFIVSGKLKENVPYLSQFQIYQAPQTGRKMKPTATYGNRVSTLHPCTPAPLFHDPLTVAYESTNNNSRIPPFSSTPLGYVSHLTSKSADMQSMKKLPHATESSVEFPFLLPDSGEHVRPSWLQNPSTSLPPWLSGSQQKGTPVDYFYSYSDVEGRNHPSTMHGSNFQTFMTHPSTMHEFIPIPSASKVRGERMKFKDRVIRRVSVKEPCHELDYITHKAGTKKCGEIQIGMADGIGKTGPIRLSAGAKHILKSSSDRDQDNFRPNVSFIPFVAATSSGRVSESENKSAYIYRF